MNETKYRVQNKLNLLSIIIENQGIELSELLKYTTYPSINRLREELEKLFLVGSYPYTPADFIEIVYLNEDRVEVLVPNNLDKTIGLTVEEWSAILNLLVSEVRNSNTKEEDKLIYENIIKKLKPIIPYTDYFANQGIRDLIEKAIGESKKIKFQYIGWKNKTSEEKIVNPNLLFFANEEYLSAFYDSIEEHRYFRISNISNLEILEQKIHSDILANSSTEQIEKFKQFIINSSSDSIEAELLISEDIEFNLSKQLEIQIISSENDFIKIRTKIIEGNWFLNIIKSYGNKITILSPESLIDKYIEELNQIKSIEVLK